MPIFQHGRSCIWIFFVYAVFFVAVGMVGGNLRAVALSMPIVMGGILLVELHSGIALDSYWRAMHKKGTWQYTALVLWHTAATIVFSIAACVFWTSID